MPRAALCVCIWRESELILPPNSSPEFFGNRAQTTQVGFSKGCWMWCKGWWDTKYASFAFCTAATIKPKKTSLQNIRPRSCCYSIKVFPKDFLPSFWLKRFVISTIIFKYSQWERWISFFHLWPVLNGIQVSRPEIVRHRSPYFPRNCSPKKFTDRKQEPIMLLYFSRIHLSAKGRIESRYQG